MHVGKKREKGERRAFCYKQVGQGIFINTKKNHVLQGVSSDDRRRRRGDGECMSGKKEKKVKEGHFVINKWVRAFS